MVILYCLSTPLGVALGIIFRVFNSDLVEIQLAIGFSEAFCGGVLAYDSIGNLLPLHFFGEYYRSCDPWKQNVHTLAFLLGLAIMTIMGLWA